MEGPTRERSVEKYTIFKMSQIISALWIGGNTLLHGGNNQERNSACAKEKEMICKFSLRRRDPEPSQTLIIPGSSKSRLNKRLVPRKQSAEALNNFGVAALVGILCGSNTGELAIRVDLLRLDLSMWRERRSPYQ